MGIVRTRACAALAVALAAGCGDDWSKYGPFPIGVDLTTGPMVATAGLGDDAPGTALIDTLSPVTIVDDFAGGDPGTPVQRAIELRLYTGAATRAEFGGVDAFDLHPCARVDGPCQVGTDATVQDVRLLVGTDLLSRAAVRLDLAASTIQFFPDIAGDDEHRTEHCDAVFPNVLAGGGTLLLGESEIDVGAHQLALGACLHHDPATPAPAVRGADALFVVATGLPISLIGDDAWERYRAVVGDDLVAPPADSLPATVVHLPSGPVSGRLGSITRMALTGEGSSESEERGPCMELYASHLMADEQCKPDSVDPADPCDRCGGDFPELGPCPCKDEGDDFCDTGAAIELDRSFPIVVIDDEASVLQAVRNQLRPELAEVDGLLVAGALAPLIMDIDYPNGRLVSRCADPTTCTARPRIADKDKVEAVNRCLGQ